MKTTRTLWMYVVCGVGALGMALGAEITKRDSTQPRGSATGLKNAAGQSLDPVVDGFRHPTRRGDAGYSPFGEWAGNTMANSMPDPAFLAELASANQDQIKLLNALYNSQDPDPQVRTRQRQQALALLNALGLRLGASAGDLTNPAVKADIYFNPATSKLEPEEKLPVVANLCLRCHTPAGWLEAKSEPATWGFPFLKGQFWGAAFTEFPGNRASITVAGTHPNETLQCIYRRAPGRNRAPGTNEAEGEMEGVSCDFCHRAVDNSKRTSLFSGAGGARLAAGNGGFFVLTRDHVNGPSGIGFTSDFVKKGDFCGTCHDVTNPVIKTATTIGGRVPDMLHPIERTYTEWYWSSYRTEGVDCQECHKPMEFPGAQTWLLDRGMRDIWGAVNSVWTKSPYNYNVPETRDREYAEAAARNRQFMQKAADLQIVSATRNGSTATVRVRITNKTGHKLPTGFAEGRQMWVDLTMIANNVVTQVDGGLNPVTGTVTAQKIYEQTALAKGYENVKINGFSIIDDDHNGGVSTEEKKFHFVLMNNIVKDNRIPPAGFNKAAYQADGAFIVPESLYQSNQNWDETTYVINNVPAGPVTFWAVLRYRTFDEKYVGFLKEHGDEKTVRHGGRAGNIPEYGFYGGYDNWGAVIHDVWDFAGKGSPVQMASVSQVVNWQSAERGRLFELRNSWPERPPAARLVFLGNLDRVSVPHRPDLDSRPSSAGPQPQRLSSHRAEWDPGGVRNHPPEARRRAAHNGRGRCNRIVAVHDGMPESAEFGFNHGAGQFLRLRQFPETVPRPE